MSKLLRLTGWLLLAIVVLIVALLALIRFRPDAAIWAANGLLDDTHINAEGLEVRYFPPSLNLAQADIALPDQTIDVSTAAAKFDASAWRSDAPFWSVTAGSVLINTTAPPTPEPAGAVNLAIPDLSPFLTFTRLSVDKLEMTGDSPLTASLNADRQNAETVIDARVTQAGTQYVLTGTVSSTATGPMPFNFEVKGTQIEAATESTPADAGKRSTDSLLKAQLQGVLSHSNGTQLVIENGSVTMGDDAQKLDQLKGLLRIPKSGDRVELETISALLTSTDAGLKDLPLNLNAVAKFSAEDINLSTDGSLDQTAFELALAVANETGALSGTVNLQSKGLPEGIETAPYTAEQLFPASLATGFNLTDTEISLNNLTIDTPRNALGGSIDASTVAPWTLVADISASKLFVPLVGAETAETPSQDEDEGQQQVAEAAVDQTAEGVKTKPTRVFSEEAIDWSWLESATIDAKLAAEELALQDAKFTNLNISLANKNGELSLDPLSASLGDGGFSGSSKLTLLSDRADGEAAAVSLTALFTMSGVALEAFGLVPTEELSGGKVEANINLKSEGNSQAQLAAGLNGEILLMVEEATLMNDFIELAGSDLVMETLNKLNPFAKKDPTTKLSCALVRFTAVDGKLTTKNQLVMETSKMEIIGTGNVNLNDEKISLGITPNAKSGVGVNVGSAVKFMKLGGTLAAPKPAVSAGGLLKSGLAIGAAISTGGASVVAEGLAKRALNAGSACEAARKKAG